MQALFRVAPWVLLAVMSCADKSGDTDSDTGTLTSTVPATSSDSDAMGTSTAPTTGTPPPTGDTPASEPPGDTTSEPPGDTTSEPPGDTTSDPTGDSSGGSSEVSTGAPASCEGDTPKVRLVTTMGDLVVQLDAVNAPITVANFVHYVESGFYVDTIFHRVVPDFVIQGGGLTADLQEKPTDPPIALETSPALKHVNGAISMARTNDPNSATSQFFLCDGPQDFLDGQYAAFGVLVEGFDVLSAIISVPTETVGIYEGVPVEDVLILSATCE